MDTFKDHLLYVIVTVVVIGCATALVITGHIGADAALGLFGAAIPSGIGLGRHLATTADNPSTQPPVTQVPDNGV